MAWSHAGNAAVPSTSRRAVLPRTCAASDERSIARSAARTSVRTATELPRGDGRPWCAGAGGGAMSVRSLTWGGGANGRGPHACGRPKCRCDGGQMEETGRGARPWVQRSPSRASTAPLPGAARLSLPQTAGRDGLASLVTASVRGRRRCAVAAGTTHRASPQPVLRGDVREQAGAGALHDVVHVLEAAGA